MPRSTLSEIERGLAPYVTFVHAAIVAAVLGLDLSVRLYPAGRAIRDAGQLRLLARFKPIVSAAWRWQYEVGLAIDGDLRAWDAVIVGPLRIAIELETHLYHVQALVRRVQLKLRDSNVERVILVMADTRHNRAVLAAAADVLGTFLPCPRRRLLAALRAGTDPGANGYVLV